jgi:DNA-binding CsgD family transcriptional regulator
VISSKALSELIHTLYSAAESEALWPAFLSDLSKLLNLTGAAIIYHDLERGLYNTEFSWGNEEWKPGYHRYYGPLDMWRPRFMETKSVGDFASGRELCPMRDARKTEFYHDHVRKCDLDLLAAIATVKTSTQIEQISLFQSWTGATPNEENAVELMKLLFPHLKSALDLRRKFVWLRTYADALEAAIDLCDAAIILLDQKGRTGRLNRSAELLLAARKGLEIRDRYLHAISTDDNAALQMLIGRVIRGRKLGAVSPGGSLLVTQSSGRPLALTVAPLITATTSLPAPAIAALVFVHDPDSRVRPPMDLLRDGYQLTEAEAQIAMLLVEGNSLPQVAERRAVSHHTARHQLKSIFLKTGTRHQGELIRLLMRSRLEVSARPLQV